MALQTKSAARTPAFLPFFEPEIENIPPRSRGVGEVGLRVHPHPARPAHLGHQSKRFGRSTLNLPPIFPTMLARVR